MSGTGRELLERPEVRAAYLEGGAAAKPRRRLDKPRLAARHSEKPDGRNS